MNKKLQAIKNMNAGHHVSYTPRNNKKVNINAPQDRRQPQSKEDYQKKPSPRENSIKKGDEPRMWPSARIPQGGLFHTPKFQYSQETADLIRCK